MIFGVIKSVGAIPDQMAMTSSPSSSNHTYYLRPRRRPFARDAESESDANSNSDSESESDCDCDYDYEPGMESSEEEEEVMSPAMLGYGYRVGGPPKSSHFLALRAKTKTETEPWTKGLSPEEKSYLKTLRPEETFALRKQYEALIETSAANEVPFRFKLLGLPDTVLSAASKKQLFQRWSIFQTMTPDQSDYAKYASWFQALSSVPFGHYQTLPSSPTAIPEILQRIQHRLHSAVFGHNDTKQHLLTIMAQWLTNPTSKGRCIGIQGPMGIGKTTLMKEGVSQALGFPFGFIALGGASDAAFLEGHSFTYEGATYGRIAELLIKLGVMNPVLFFDELDKVSESPKGDEISSLLTHLTDPTQNALFTDKYFGSVELDLSRCLMVFSFNDLSKINPILRDRLTIIHVDGYSTNEKLQLAQSHLLPRLYQQFSFSPQDLPMSESLLRSVLSYCPEEKGVRQFIQALEALFGWVHLARYVVVPPHTKTIELPYQIDPSHLSLVLKKPNSANSAPISMYV
jgi:ATP-dependent Lon protease